jgi:hypothetical protein
MYTYLHTYLRNYEITEIKNFKLSYRKNWFNLYKTLNKMQYLARLYLYAPLVLYDAELFFFFLAVRFFNSFLQLSYLFA